MCDFFGKIVVEVVIVVLIDDLCLDCIDVLEVLRWLKELCCNKILFCWII